jgi:uncharacterized membrane protein YeaQ/YmgE (transglycosylase-associated protein family)
MGLVIWLIAGGVVGWLSVFLKREVGQRRIFPSVYIGMMGAFIGGLAWGLFISSDVSIGSVIVSVIGAIVALAAVPLFRR